MLYKKENTRIESRYRVYGGLDYSGTCAWCGDSFKAAAPHAMYCSQRCANDAAMERRRQRAQQHKATHNHCEVCGEPIEQGPGKVRKYCSNKCKQQAYRRKRYESCWDQFDPNSQSNR